MIFLKLRDKHDEADYQAYFDQVNLGDNVLRELHKMPGQTVEVKGLIYELTELMSDKVELGKQVHVTHNIYGSTVKNVITIKDDIVVTRTIRDLIDRIDTLLEQNVQDHQHFVERYWSLNILFLIGIFAVAIILIGFFAFAIFSELNRRVQTENELRLAQQAALSASNLKSQFLANVSHEIRTPLNAIIGMTDLIREKTDSKETKKYAQLVVNSGKTLLRIVNDILDFSKIEANKIEFEINPVALSEVLQASKELFDAKALEKSLKLTLGFNPACKEYYATDRDRLSQIINNLIGNAIKFTQTGSIEVIGEITQKDQSLFEFLFKVTDTGSGVAPEQKELLFQPFNQLENAKNKEGTGLGLSIAKELVERMGGQIAMESKGNKGSVFWFKIPLRKVNGIQEAQLASNANIEASQSQPIKKINNGIFRAKLLLVEDNETNQILAEAQLRGLGYEVEIANNGQECLEVLEQKDFDAILMDCRMPIMDGFEATQKIRKFEKANSKKRIPIIAMTANAVEGDREKCLAVGMDDYLAKPFELSKLNAIVQKWTFPDGMPVQWLTLKELSSKTNPEIIKKLVVSFQQTLEKSLVTIETAVKTSDKELLLNTVHQLKSSSAALGAKKLAKICEIIESKIESNQNCNDLIAEVTEEIKVVGKEFRNQQVVSLK